MLEYSKLEEELNQNQALYLTPQMCVTVVVTEEYVATNTNSSRNWSKQICRKQNTTT